MPVVRCPQPPLQHSAHSAAAHPSSERGVATDELRQKQAKLKSTQGAVEPDGQGGSQGGIYSMHDVAFAVGLVGLVGLLAREIRERTLGGDTVDTATVYNNLGCCMFFLERRSQQ